MGPPQPRSQAQSRWCRRWGPGSRPHLFAARSPGLVRGPALEDSPGQGGHRAHGAPASWAWTQRFPRGWGVRIEPGRQLTPWVGWLASPHPGAPRGGLAPAKGSAPNSGQADARPRGPRAPPSARSRLSKHSGCAPSPGPRRPYPRYPPRAHSGLRGRPCSGPTRAPGFQ